MAVGGGRALADVVVLPARPRPIQAVRSEARHAGLTLPQQARDYSWRCQDQHHLRKGQQPRIQGSYLPMLTLYFRALRRIMPKLCQDDASDDRIQHKRTRGVLREAEIDGEASADEQHEVRKGAPVRIKKRSDVSFVEHSRYKRRVRVDSQVRSSQNLAAEMKPLLCWLPKVRQ